MTTSQPHAINHGCTGRRRGSGDLADHRVKRRPKRRPSFGLIMDDMIFVILTLAVISGWAAANLYLYLHTTKYHEPTKEPNPMYTTHAFENCRTSFIVTETIPTMIYWQPALSKAENLSLAQQISENMDPPPDILIIYGHPPQTATEPATEEPELPNKQDDLDEENQENPVPCER